MKTFSIFLIITILFLSSCNKQLTSVSVNKVKNGVEETIWTDFKKNLVNDFDDLCITKSYYKEGVLEKIEYYDKEGQPLEGKDGDAFPFEWRFIYGANQKIAAIRAYNSNGEPMDTEGWSNSSIEKFEYNDKNQLIEISRYDKNEKKIGLGDLRDATIAFEYNAEGKLIYKKTYYPNGKIMTNGFGLDEYIYDNAGNLIKKIDYFDETRIYESTTFHFNNGALSNVDYFDSEDKKTSSVACNGILTKKYVVDLKLNGWKLSTQDSLDLDLTTVGKMKYKITVDENGNITDLKPAYEGGKFNYDVYNNFRGIKLEKTAASPNLEGTLFIQLKHTSYGPFREIEYFLNPTPLKNYYP
jgi:hypothetical protein